MTRRYKIILGVFTFLVIAVFPFGNNEPIKYIDRQSNEIKTEAVVGEYWLRWLYNNPVGELSLYAIVKRKFVSDWYGNKMNTPESAEKIYDFVKDYGIDLSESKKQNFTSFNDFFARELNPNARKIDTNKNVLVSPADGKIFAYDNISTQDFIVKGYRFDLYRFFNDSSLANRYKNGSLMIIRLCPTDYHRYHFPHSGEIINQKKIEGPLFSVSPIALREKIEIICRNKREYVELRTKEFGNIIMSEVGATMVGSIIQTYENKNVKKGEEKGYFLFGGSTVVLIFEEGKISIDSDLIENTNTGIETEVKMGTRLGIKKDYKLN